jgi:hypothetical protein
VIETCQLWGNTVEAYDWCDCHMVPSWSHQISKMFDLSCFSSRCSTKSPASVRFVARNDARQALANHVALEGVAALPGLPCQQTPDSQGSSHIHLVFPLQFSKWSEFLHSGA